jgi:DNA-binding NarL/FixJ family response regulator
MKKLRILIADDHELVRRGALTILQAQNGWRVVGEATNGREAAEKTAKVKPDIVIVDVSMSELDGIEVVRQIRIVTTLAETIRECDSHTQMHVTNTAAIVYNPAYYCVRVEENAVGFRCSLALSAVSSFVRV